MSVANKIKLNSFDSLFGEESSLSADIKEIDISLLRGFKEHPFKVIHDEKMEELIESIKENGVLSPIIVRRVDNGYYEIISGHRRRYACKELGIKCIPAVIKDYTDDEATVVMVDSNLQREEILPSEKAYSYKMKLDAMKRQGKRTDLDENDDKGMKSADKLAEEVGESRANIRRYIRLTYLSNVKIDGMNESLDDVSLIELVDRKKLPLNAAVEISYLNEDEQMNLIIAMEETERIPSLKQAIKLREYAKDKELTEDICSYILQEEKETPKTVRLKSKTLEQFFPDTYTAEEMEDVILVLLEKWAKDKDLKKAEQWAKEEDKIN